MKQHRAIFKNPATLLHQPNLTLTTARNIHAFYNYSSSENAIYQCEPTANILDIAQYIVLHALFTTIAFLIKLFKNFKEQVEDFFNVTSDSLVKNSANQLKSNKAIKLRCFKVFKCCINPTSFTFSLFCDTNSL